MLFGSNCRSILCRIPAPQLYHLHRTSAPVSMAQESGNLGEKRRLCFWTRGGTPAHFAATGMAMKEYLDHLQYSQDCLVTYASMPLWYLQKDFAIETLTLEKKGGTSRVRFSGGPLHGYWHIVRDDPQRDGSTFLVIAYGQVQVTGGTGTSTLSSEIKEHRYEILWGTSNWIKRPDAEGDTLPWCHWLAPLIDYDKGAHAWVPAPLAVAPQDPDDLQDLELIRPRPSVLGMTLLEALDRPMIQRLQKPLLAFLMGLLLAFPAKKALKALLLKMKALLLTRLQRR